MVQVRCVFTVHKEYIKLHKIELIKVIINEFGLLSRNIELLLSHQRSFLSYNNNLLY